MQIKHDGGRSNEKSGDKNRLGGRAQWVAVFLGCMLLSSMAWLLFTPLAGWSAAPALKLGPFTNISGVSYVSLAVTNGTSTNIYQIDNRADLAFNVPWVGSTTGTLGQTNFLIPMTPANYMFYRAINGDDWDLDGVPNSRDANPRDAIIGILTITIVSPTNGANITF